MAINFPSAPILDQIFTSGNTSFIWNGTAWVGYSTSFVVNYNASSVVIQDDNSIVGATTSINFGDNLTVSAISAGIVTVTGSASGSSSQFVTTAAGIHTLSNVGIGTTNPTEELHIYGTAPDIQIEGTSSTNASQLLFKNNVGNFSFIGKVGSAYNNISYPTFSPNSLSIYNIDNSNLIFGTNNLERFRVSGGGNVGIGTTNPTSKLTVSGDALINGITVGLGGSAVTNNTAIGSSALYSNTTGNYNTGIGFESLESNITANSNTGIGYRTLFTNRYGTQNVAIGLQSLFALDGGGYNTATGASSLAFVVTGANNTATGYGSLNETTASNNTGIGYLSGSSITTGSKNTLLGSYDGNQNGLDIRTSSNNVVLSDGDGNIRFYANSSGNVGLGTTNPRFKLEVGAVGASGTSLYVNGNARVTGVLALGLASILLDGDTNTISVGSGITISGSTGIISATTFYGDTSNAVDGRWTIGNSGLSEYTFTGIGFTQTTNNPVLYLGRGRVYEFVIASGSSHPFEIRESNGGSAYIGGVVGNGTTNGGIVRFEVPFNSPNTLYYQCTNHSGMGNTISVYPSTI